MKNHHWQNAVPGSDTAQLKSISWKSMVTPIEAGIVIYQWTDTLYIYIDITYNSLGMEYPE